MLRNANYNMSDSLSFDPNKDAVPSGFIKLPDEDKPQLLVSGTFIGTEVGTKYNSTEPQNIYLILTKEGAVMKLNGRPKVDDQMRVIKKGQYIGVYFRGLGEEKKGKNRAKLVEILTRGEMNEEWLAEQEATQESAPDLDEIAF